MSLAQSSFVAYPVLLRVAHCPSVSLQGPACCLLLLSHHSDLPLDALVHRRYGPGALLLFRAVSERRPLHTLRVRREQFQNVKKTEPLFLGVTVRNLD